MLQQYHTKLKGTLALTDSYLTEKALQKEKGLYKFIWVRQGSITVEIDHQEMVLSKDDVISLPHLQHLEFKSIEGEYMTLLFNSNFYCIIFCETNIFTFNFYRQIVCSRSKSAYVNVSLYIICGNFSFLTPNLCDEFIVYLSRQT